MLEQDGDGRLLLHYALVDDDVSLGSIKLMMKVNPNAVRIAGHRGLIALHIACQCRSLDMVKLLVEFDKGCMDE